MVGSLAAWQTERVTVTRGLRLRLLHRKVVLIGANIQAQHVVESLARHDHDQPSLVVGIYDERAVRRLGSTVHLPVSGNADAWISAAVMIPMEKGVFNVRTSSVSAIAGEPALQVMRQPLRGARSLVKLIEDYAVAVVAIALATPMMLIYAGLVRLDSPGPCCSGRRASASTDRHSRC